MRVASAHPIPHPEPDFGALAGSLFSKGGQVLPSIWARKLFCFVPSGLGVALVLALWLSLSHPAESNDYTVCPSGCDYTTIQSAVTGVEEGSTILVAAGVYTESVLITQSL